MFNSLFRTWFEIESKLASNYNLILYQVFILIFLILMLSDPFIILNAKAKITASLT